MDTKPESEAKAEMNGGKGATEMIAYKTDPKDTPKKMEKVDKVDKVEKMEKPEKVENMDKMDQMDKSIKMEKSALKHSMDKTDKMDKPDKPITREVKINAEELPGTSSSSNSSAMSYSQELAARRRQFMSQPSTVATRRQQAVCVRRAHKNYGPKNNPNVILDGLNMTVPKGSMYVIRNNFNSIFDFINSFRWFFCLFLICTVMVY